MDGEVNAGLSTILTGMGSLSYGELAGERMKLGLLLHDPEEEHDCFSDNKMVGNWKAGRRKPIMQQRLPDGERDRTS